MSKFSNIKREDWAILNHKKMSHENKKVHEGNLTFMLNLYQNANAKSQIFENSKSIVNIS